MKKLVVLMVAGCLLLIPAGMAGADSASFDVSATVDAGTSVTFQVTEVLEDGTWTTNHPANMNFGTLAWNLANQIFLPVRYFALDLGVDGSGAVTDINFSYVEGTGADNPNEGSGRGGLGTKATIEVVRAVYESDDETISGGGPALLIEADTDLPEFTSSDFTGGWPRAYIGIYDGSDETANADGWETFNADDAVGTYTGTLYVTAAVL